jgi:hypothetical protein
VLPPIRYGFYGVIASRHSRNFRLHPEKLYMTNPPDKPPQRDQANPETPHTPQTQASVSAELRDADDQAVSKGSATLYPGEMMEATFQPLDPDDRDKILSHAETLFLTETKQKLGPYKVLPPGPGCGVFHFHLVKRT